MMYIKKEENNSLNLCFDSMKKISESKDKSISNLLYENTKLHSQLMFYRYAVSLIFIASVIAYTFVGEC